MNTDRFKFRVWDNERKRFTSIDPSVLCSRDNIRTLCMKDDNESRFIIEQCTGQKDQSGKLVYEGDIVEQYSPMEDCRRRCVVVWEDGPGGGYVCKYLDGKGNPCAHGNSEGTYFDGAWCVVVGNIHENPEMVK